MWVCVLYCIVMSDEVYGVGDRMGYKMWKVGSGSWHGVEERTKVEASETECTGHDRQ